MDAFKTSIATVVDAIGKRPLDGALADDLNRTFPENGDIVTTLAEACARGEEQGWLMQREAGGIKFGRAVKPGAEAGRFSVDVVRMKDVKGPHHVHTNGEIGLLMPIDGAPRFDGFDGPWYVYEPGSAHHPTVSGGDAYVLYLLPEGAIEFTGK
ncbi:hypothetical protein GGD81_004787 [Rhodobium orientis]|uniref:DUF4863 domain-containing protein n=1 Tax=Rhodobium orientis TaxID=34017 RepID=A0A327JGT8_9HYPH|nr:DUF4863 family protein [Rhodobium orientis]MBB4305705.1 hypothetical protein [Rhodobium orientis]MBK5947880.1 DUF4863 domain-containing protein [Rhodobium orientis]RAI24307.1 DUF4863 domain-containing protein [Rhodobium orientis]